MNLVAKLLILVCLCLGNPAIAQEKEVGVGLLCDTQKQVEQVLHLANTGATMETALDKVNGSQRPLPCMVLVVEYVKGEKVGQIRAADGLYDIHEILVVGLVLPNGLIGSIIPSVQYTPFKSPGSEI